MIILGGLGFYLSRPLFASYYLKKGITEYQSGETNALERSDFYFQKSLWWNSSDPLVHYYLARIAFGHGAPMIGYTAWIEADWPRVIEHYEKALALGLENKDARRAEFTLSDIGMAYRKLGDYEKGDAILRQHIERYPARSFVSRYLVASDDFAINNNPDEALKVLIPALNAEDKIDLRMFGVYTLLARLYTYASEFDKGAEYAALAISNAPDGEKAHLDLQIAHILLSYNEARKGHMAEAEAEIHRAEKLAGAPNLHVCYLARTYSFGKQYSKAIKPAGVALGQTPLPRSRQVCMQSLYEAHLALGNKKEAKQYLAAYLETTDTFQPKNIFTVREREKAKRELDLLSAGN